MVMRKSLLLVASGIFFASCSVVSAVTLGISADGRFFTLNGIPTYLNGVSYYGAQTITTASYVTQDLDDMVADGFNWIRVWMYWTDPVTGEDVSVMTDDGTVRTTYMNRLKTLITECNTRGMIVDCSFNRDGNNSWVGPTNQTQHLAAVQTLATELYSYTNIYFDLANECDVTDSRYVSPSELSALRARAKQYKPGVLCTASQTPSSATDLYNKYISPGLDFISPHLCRDSTCPALTLGKVKDFISWMGSYGVRMPVHLQEPFRRGYGSWQPGTSDFLRDCIGGKNADGAGWCLHNGSNYGSAPYRSFRMTNSNGRLYSQWETAEQNACDQINDHIAGTDPYTRRYQVEWDEQLSKSIGRSDGDGRSANVSQDALGYLTYGPYITSLPAGAYQITWRMMIDNNSADNNTVVTIDVYNATTSTVLATQPITRQQFAAPNVYQNFIMSFNYATAGQQLEFRTYWHDLAYIKVDYIDVRPQVSDEPLIAEVTPDPDTAKPGVEYQRIMILIQGLTPVTWSVVAAPVGVVVDSSGLVKGWTPTGSLAGIPQYFEIKAENSAGFDTESWYVNVVIPDFDGDGDVDLQDFGYLQACYSGSGITYRTGCGNADWDDDGDVDQTDFTKFKNCLGGAGRPPGC